MKGIYYLKKFLSCLNCAIYIVSLRSYMLPRPSDSMSSWSYNVYKLILQLILPINCGVLFTNLLIACWISRIILMPMFCRYVSHLFQTLTLVASISNAVPVIWALIIGCDAETGNVEGSNSSWLLSGYAGLEVLDNSSSPVWLFTSHLNCTACCSD